jgi:hypothetical protein
MLKRVRRAHPDWKVPFPSKVDLAGELIDGAVEKGSRYPLVMDSTTVLKKAGIFRSNMLY